MAQTQQTIGHEDQRLAALHDYQILDSLPEQAYNDIVALAAFICQVPIALISFVDKDRQWFKAKVGIDVAETSRELSFCAHAIRSDSLFLVPDTQQDERFADHPLVAGSIGIRYYAGMPLVAPGGYRLGTICVIDRKPREVTDEQKQALEALGRQVVNLLELNRLRRRDKDVQAELQGFNTVLQNALEGIAQVDAEGSLRSVNTRYAAAFGYKTEQMLGMPWLGTMHPGDIETVASTQIYMRKRGRAELEARGLRKNGATCHLHLTMVAMPGSDGAEAGFYCFLRDITEQKMLQSHLARGAYHDPLTELPNRLFFEESLNTALGRTARNDAYLFTVLFLDLDGFKPVNDGFGHIAGDRVLRETARRLAACVRPGDVVSRLGGDEFGVMLDDVLSINDAREAADRIREALGEPIYFEGTPLYIGVSIGLCAGNLGMKDGADLLRRADVAMYKAKHSGKNQVVVYDTDSLAQDETIG